MTKQNNNTPSSRPALTSEQIAAIYPAAKTYDEKLNDRQKREASLPRINLYHLTFGVSMRTYALAILLIAVIFLVPQLVTWNVISGVFFAFFLVLVWLGVAWWQLSSLAKPFYFTGLSLTVFILFYCLIAAPATYGLLTLTAHTHNQFLILPLGTITHFVLCYAIMTLLIKSKRVTQD